MKNDDDVKNVLKEDGLDSESLHSFHQFENITTINLEDLRNQLGM